MLLDLVNCIADIFSISVLVYSCIIFILMFFTKIKSWLMFKILNVSITFILNITLALCLYWFYAIPAIIIISIIGIIVINKIDVENTYKYTMLGGYSVLTKKRDEQIEKFKSMSFIEQEKYLKTVPKKEKMKVNVVPFLIISLIPAIILSLYFKTLFKY